VAALQPLREAARLLYSPLGERVVAMALEAILGVAFGFSVTDEDESHRSKYRHGN
jgi:hypothetical protein